MSFQLFGKGTAQMSQLLQSIGRRANRALRIHLDNGMFMAESAGVHGLGCLEHLLLGAIYWAVQCGAEKAKAGHTVTMLEGPPSELLEPGHIVQLRIAPLAELSAQGSGGLPLCTLESFRKVDFV